VSESTRKPRKGDVLDVDVVGLDERGHALARFGEHTVRVRGGVPGSRARVSVRRRRKGRIEAVLETTLEPGPDAVEPRCAHFGTCGGCSFQGLSYPAQLRELERMLRRTLEPLGTPAVEEVEPVLGASGEGGPWHYRNKMDFTFGNKRWIEADEPAGAPNGFAVGLHVPGRFDKILDVAHCDIAFAGASEILATVRALALELDLDAWDVREHRGLLRHLVLRKGFRTGELMVDLVTTERAAERVDPLVERLLAAHPEVTTLVQRVDSGVALIARGEEHVLFGPGFLHEEIDGISFRISAASFFQTNTRQAEELVRLVRENAVVGPGTRVFDLYCGSGLFSLALARAGADVVGFELVEAAVADARANAERNGIDGLHFVAGDLAQTLSLEAVAALPGGAPEVCVVDPPRAGLHASVLGVLGELGAARIVYVSCNPKSAARDLAPLLERGYRLGRVQPVDLFPHTPHLECVFTLQRDG